MKKFYYLGAGCVGISYSLFQKLKMLLSISVFVLVVIARGGSVLPNGIQNNGGAIVAADINSR